MDYGDHDPPSWTRSVQDHLGPRSDISLMFAKVSHGTKKGQTPSAFALGSQWKLAYFKAIKRAKSSH